MNQPYVKKFKPEVVNTINKTVLFDCKKIAWFIFDFPVTLTFLPLSVDIDKEILEAKDIGTGCIITSF